MVSPCYNHASVSSSASCVQCGMPFCKDCLEAVAGRPVCKHCLPAMRASVEQQMASAPPPPSYAAPQGTYPGYAPQTAAMAVPDAGAGGKALLMGIGLSLLIGIIGAVIIEKILFYGHFDLSLLYIALGYGIGWGLHRIIGRGGSGLALVAVGVMVASLGVSHLFYAQDLLNMLAERVHIRAGMTALDVFPAMMKSLSFIHWVCIAFGLLACYRGVEARQ